MIFFCLIYDFDIHFHNKRFNWNFCDIFFVRNSNRADFYVSIVNRIVWICFCYCAMCVVQFSLCEFCCFCRWINCCADWHKFIILFVLLFNFWWLNYFSVLIICFILWFMFIFVDASLFKIFFIILMIWLIVFFAFKKSSYFSIFIETSLSMSLLQFWLISILIFFVEFE